MHKLEHGYQKPSKICSFFCPFFEVCLKNGLCPSLSFIKFFSAPPPIFFVLFFFCQKKRLSTAKKIVNVLCCVIKSRLVFLEIMYSDFSVDQDDGTSDHRKIIKILPFTAIFFFLNSTSPILPSLSSRSTKDRVAVQYLMDGETNSLLGPLLRLAPVLCRNPFLLKSLVIRLYRGCRDVTNNCC